MNILKRLFTSSARVKLMQLFLMNPDNEYFVRELTRVLNEQINSIRREVDNLKKIGLLTSRAKNRKKYFKLNASCLIYEELKNLFLKTMDAKDALIRKLSKLGEIEFILMSGVFLKKESPVDLLIVGTVDHSVIESFLDKEVDSRNPIRFSVMSKQDFLYRVDCNDMFVTKLLKDKSNIVGINKLTKQLSQFIS
ncbi:hypothetical protein A2335_04540 [Candidatus Peregrinibacteria bacterium RIFOXYB2_FULL_32_7]|nr:MAG: hypothetical protein A2335_04540 [Candidatus Peregrinibacteria bacterium RIFOXYB2_FULL_32_7]